MFLLDGLKGARVGTVRPTIYMQNISDWYCCKELEGCVESMSSELVLQDLAADKHKL